MNDATPRAARGRSAPIPPGYYEPPALLVVPREGGSPLVRFVGEDQRESVFRFALLPLAGLHEDFARALAARIGPDGGRRTQRAAMGQWQSIRRFFTVLAHLADPPQRVEDLRVRHVERYRMSRLETCAEKTALKHVQELMLLLRDLPDQERLEGTLRGYLCQRGHGVNVQQPGLPGYSDREFSAVMAAARSDVVAIRDRLAAAELLLERYRENPSSLAAPARERGALLAAMALQGRVQVDYRGLVIGAYAAANDEQARQLFVVDDDLAPLMIYAAGMTGRNPGR
ncbi:hypothetical protein G3I60_30230 [Streptomyces sp. SID13666]|uniref:hypothetical protein n=1 Tax=unclassified Streptomyces TaxID=2593676 RepID=UPI0013C09486|nr:MULTISPECIES: hypothetical protein [unclassified Streptomyces]NEA58318.1 hypothetical protein [Streptomyces sp. SID13666]NEA76554.1 hypothetical protein [Streptomyces sp. SID13588]